MLVIVDVGLKLRRLVGVIAVGGRVGCVGAGLEGFVGPVRLSMFFGRGGALSGGFLGSNGMALAGMCSRPGLLVLLWLG